MNTAARRRFFDNLRHEVKNGSFDRENLIDYLQRSETGEPGSQRDALLILMRYALMGHPGCDRDFALDLVEDARNASGLPADDYDPYE